MVLKKIKKYQIVLISDYGHGLISEGLAYNIIKNKKKDLFVNTQLNAANFGYHTIGKYKNSSCAVINEVELRHEMRNRNQDVLSLLPLLSKKLNIKKLIVTAGAKGSYGFIRGSQNIYHCPAFTNDYKDKIGAGDCYMGIFSIIYKIYPKDIELAMFVASLATIDIMSGYGSEFAVDKTRLKKRILYILK
jgi:bifunctional ADP-heptose synthase (sugar kinase/adenylyltransferase)